MPVREDRRVSFDGVWDFQIDPRHSVDNFSEGEWRTATVPGPWQAQFDDLRNTSGVGWYRRRFAVTWHLTSETAAILHFGAVDYHATIWLNGKLIGAHEGGYLPFEFDIAKSLQEGENELVVKVVDSTDERQFYPDFPFSEVPHGKQSWYGPIGGIWQSVWLEFRPRLHIAQVRLNPSPHDATVAIQVTLSQSPQDSYKVHYAIKAPNAEAVESGILAQGLNGLIHLNSSPKLWSPESPNLYTVITTLYINDHPIHSVQKTCGFRTIESRNGRIYLNGQPIYLRGVLDQGYYPETLYTPSNLELLESQARSAKALGFNCLRIHIKVEDPRYYEVADRLGLLVWTEIPSWALLTEASATRAKQTFDGMVARDGHHPSIIAWTLVNENWGTDLTRNVEHRRWLADFYHYAKSVDPARLVIDNSACGGNAHVASDLEDFHNYRAIPDHAGEWDEWVADFSKRSDWTWYADFAHERWADLPLIVSEFGNWGLPDPETIRESGGEPWWFETGFDLGGGIVYPHGVQERYVACGLSDLFSSYAEFTRCAQEHMARSLHYEISTLRLHQDIAGYIITEFTDVHWECNGLLTMQRQPKHGLDPLLKNVNHDQVIVLRPKQWSGRLGERIEVLVQAMGIARQHYDGVVQWRIGSQSGQLPASNGILSVLLDQPGILTLQTDWLAEGGTRLATNQIDLVCIPVQQVSTRLHVVDDQGLANILRRLGYEVSEGEATEVITDQIVVASCYTKALETYVQRGGRAILLADVGQSGEALPVGYIAARAGTAWQGDWANSIAWIKKQGPLTHLPGGPPLEMEYAVIMPEAVLAGLPTWILRNHSWAGLAVGWLHQPVSLLAAMPYGRGQLLVTTFKLNATTLAKDAIAQALFVGMLNLFEK